MLHQATYGQLYQACYRLSHHRQSLAYPNLSEMLLQHIDNATPNAELLGHIIAESLYRRRDNAYVESRNIYIQRFGIPQIEMFYKMARAYPHIYASHDAANQFLWSRLRNMREATFFDIGVGKGIQLKRLLRRLATDRDSKLTRLSVVALDPDPSNIEDTRKLLAQYAGSLPFTLHYEGIETLLEQMTDDDFERIALMSADGLVINSAYTLHHIAFDPRETTLRDRLIARLAAMKPRALTIVEPNSNHNTEDLCKRLSNCWQHFGSAFELIDESPLSSEEKFHIKETFFGREVRDMFGNADRFRTERHEPLEAWLLRLARTPLQPIRDLKLDIRLPSHSCAAITDGLVRFTYRRNPLIALMAYESP